MNIRLANIKDFNKIVNSYLLSDDKIKSVYYNEAIVEGSMLKHQLYLCEINEDILATFVLNKEYDKRYSIERLCINSRYNKKEYIDKLIFIIKQKLKEKKIYISQIQCLKSDDNNEKDNNEWKEKLQIISEKDIAR